MPSPATHFAIAFAIAAAAVFAHASRRLPILRLSRIPASPFSLPLFLNRARGSARPGRRGRNVSDLED